MKYLGWFFLCFIWAGAFGQTEFKKNSTALNLEFLQGFTKPQSFTAFYLADLRLSDQYTVVPGTLRLGATAAGTYNNDIVSAFAGPNLALKVYTMNSPMGSLGNIHLLLEHLWGTDSQKLVGGGIRAAIGNTLLVS